MMPSRLEEYENIIIKCKQNGYHHLTISEYYSKLKSKNIEGEKYFLHRHDIDTDVKTAKLFFEIEKKHNIKATYYFRLSTLDLNFTKEINAYGSEASYHFEEIATFCKKNKIKSKKKARQELSKITADFRRNFTTLENQLGYKLKTVASHGDFVNRKLNLINNEITDNLALRKELGIECETYDSILKNSFNEYISDKIYPIHYYPKNIFDVIGKANIICLLTHPRQWNSNIKESIKDTFLRIYEGLKFKLS